MPCIPRAKLNIRYVGGPTAVVEIGGVRLLLDPTFDPPGEYPVGERVLSKTLPPALGPNEIGPIDAVLLSHDQHPDNLDRLGREYLMTAPLVLSTPAAAARIGVPVRALENWAFAEFSGAGAPPIRVTAVPALHGPPGSEALVGEVTGFAVGGPGLPSVYISGDNASLDLVREIDERLGPFDVAILFAGAARTPLIDGAPLTLTSEMAAEAVHILGTPETVILHFEGWAHFTEGAESLRAAFARHRLLDRLHLPAPGESITLGNALHRSMNALIEDHSRGTETVYTIKAAVGWTYIDGERDPGPVVGIRRADGGDVQFTTAGEVDALIEVLGIVRRELWGKPNP
jgi:L-ascorbate metabolism protein UlaG (beta-lactamase superfamily)